MLRWPSWTRDPAFHFLIIAGIYGLVSHWETSPENRLILSRDLQGELWATFETQNGREPNESEWSRLREDLVTESILVREARKLGLHEEDTIIRRRLAQKMEKLARVSAIDDPTEDELTTYMEAHRERYGNPARMDLEHHFFSRDKRGLAAQSDAIFARKALEKGGVPLSDAFPHGSTLNNRSLEQLTSLFGADFTTAIPPASSDWYVASSSFGFHVVRITNRRPAELPALTTIRDRVESDWRVDNRRSMNSPWLEKTRLNYTIEWEAFPE